MYRRPKELKYLKRKARFHSVSASGRSKLKVEYKDLTQAEYQVAVWHCTCEWCQDGKQHKHLRRQLADPFEEIGDEFDADFYHEEYFGLGVVIDEHYLDWLGNEYYTLDGKYLFPYGSEFKGEKG